MASVLNFVSFVFITAPLPNLTSDDIDSALAPASTQAAYHTPSPPLFDSRQHPVITSNPSVVKSADHGLQGRYSENGESNLCFLLPLSGANKLCFQNTSTCSMAGMF